MDTVHEQAEFVGNADAIEPTPQVVSEDRASRESRDHTDGAERQDVLLKR